jgi:hypothetical protein
MGSILVVAYVFDMPGEGGGHEEENNKTNNKNKNSIRS